MNYLTMFNVILLTKENRKWKPRIDSLYSIIMVVFSSIKEKLGVGDKTLNFIYIFY